MTWGLSGRSDEERLHNETPAITVGFPLLILIALTACEREGPPKPIGTVTNKHVEQAPTPLRGNRPKR